jgi:hypothetical protein
MTEIVPTIGRIVLYRIASYQADEINARRRDAYAKFHMHKWQRNGTVLHQGNEVSAGQIVPAMIVAVWGDTPQSAVNLKVFLDGSDDYWVTSTSVGDQDGKYHWMDYQKGQAAKTEAAEAALAGVSGMGFVG